jgi:hypothetical protein
MRRSVEVETLIAAAVSLSDTTGSILAGSFMDDLESALMRRRRQSMAGISPD